MVALSVVRVSFVVWATNEKYYIFMHDLALRHYSES